MSVMPELNRIYQGNCIEIMRGWPDGFVDMIWTDPPYGHGNLDGDLASSRVGVSGGRKRRTETIQNDTPEKYDGLIESFYQEAARILRPDCCCCCCCCCGGGGPNPTFARHALILDKHLDFFHAVVWDKTARGNGLGWRYRRNYEFVMVGHRKGGRLLWNEEESAVGNIVRTPPVPNDDHPTTKPTELAGNFIKWHTLPGQIVLDPFCGSGSALLAAERLGRKWVGIEIEPKYVAIAQARIAAEQAQGKLF